MIRRHVLLVGACCLVAACSSGDPSPTMRASVSVPEQPPATESTEPPSDPAASARLRIRAVGDVMLGTDFPNSSYLPPGGASEVLGAVAPLLADADLTFANLEGPFLDGGVSSKCAEGSTSCYAFRTPTSYSGALADAGIDLASIANNHAMDFENADPSLDGRQSTIRVLDALGIAWSGPPGSIASVEADGVRVAMVAFHTFGHSNHLLDTDGAVGLVAEADRDHDVVIVSFHGGAEGTDAVRVPNGPERFLGEDRGDLRRFSRAVIDAGADLVFGHGPHVPRGIEVHDGRMVAYSLGNFATYGRFNLTGPLGLAPILEVVVDGEGAFVEGRVLSAEQVGEGVVVVDDDGEVARLMAELSALDFPDSEATVFADGSIRPRSDVG